jgi:sugar phosphate isomerase/epimerase
MADGVVLVFATSIGDNRGVLGCTSSGPNCKERVPQRLWRKTVTTDNIELIAAYFTVAGDVYPFGPTQISPFPFRDRVEAAARAGWKGIGMIPDDVEATAAKIGYAEMKRILAANDIKYFELEFLVDWYLDGERRKKSDEYRNKILAIAETFGARNVKVAPGLPEDVHHPRPEELVPDIPRMQEAFVDLCRDAANHGTAIVLEIMPFGNVRTIEAARAIVEGANQSNGSLLIDIWHMARGGIDYSEITKIPRRFIGSIELDDADQQLVGSLWDDTVHRRRLPGEGALDPRAFIRAVQSAGYQGPWGVEILSESFRKLPLAEMAERSFEATMAQFPR